MKTSTKPIIVTQLFDASIAKIWNALTDLDQMKQWYFSNIPAFEPVVGFKTQFMVKTERRVFPHIWKVTEVQNSKKISYEWTFEGYEGKGVSTFEITKEGNQNKLQLTFVTLENFPDNIPEFKRESGISGWKYFINESLMKYLTEKS